VFEHLERSFYYLFDEDVVFVDEFLLLGR